MIKSRCWGLSNGPRDGASQVREDNKFTRRTIIGLLIADITRAVVDTSKSPVGFSSWAFSAYKNAANTIAT